MRKPRYIRRATELAAEECGYNGGFGTIWFPGWTGSVAWTVDNNCLDHVSVTPRDPDAVPSLEDIQRIKEIFFDDEECALQVYLPENRCQGLPKNNISFIRITTPGFRKIFEGGDHGARG